MTRKQEPVPYTQAGGWRDNVTFMESVMARLESRVPGIRWIKPVAHGDGHLLKWDSGEYQEHDLGRLADWADAQWPPETAKAQAAVKLTNRELEIALLVAKGMRAIDVAQLLYISTRTVHSHLSKVYAKTGVTNRVQLIHWLTESDNAGQA